MHARETTLKPARPTHNITQFDYDGRYSGIAFAGPDWGVCKRHGTLSSRLHLGKDYRYSGLERISGIPFCTAQSTPASYYRPLFSSGCTDNTGIRSLDGKGDIGICGLTRSVGKDW